MTTKEQIAKKCSENIRRYAIGHGLHSQATKDAITKMVLSALQEAEQRVSVSKYTGDGFCAECGRKNDAIWSAPSELWNAVNDQTQQGILCVECFIRKAQEAGLGDCWTVTPDGYRPPEKCQCSTPRMSWNPEWKYCLGCGGHALPPSPPEGK